MGSTPTEIFFGDWCNGSTTDSDSVNIGSIPVSPVFTLVAQWNRARRYERRFVAGSSPVRGIFAKIVQLVERRSDTPEVESSNLSLCTC